MSAAPASEIPTQEEEVQQAEKERTKRKTTVVAVAVADTWKRMTDQMEEEEAEAK